MPIKLSKVKDPFVIPAGSLRDGQIAEIVESPTAGHVGRIVVRFYDNLVTIGESYELSWSRFFPSSNSRIIVRVLQPGEQLTII